MLFRSDSVPQGVIPVKLAVPASVIRASKKKEEGESAEERKKWSDALLRLAKKRAPDADIFEEEGRAPFFWQAEISNDIRDSYHTRMAESTLRAFKKNSDLGVSFQYSHDWKRLGLGQSLKGTFEGDIKGGDGEKAANMRTLTDFYTVPGMKMNAEMATDDFIAGVRSGVLRDVSVGFYAGEIKCGVCGGEMIQFWGWMWGKDCDHFPGVEYDDDYGKGVAFAWIEKGVLTEVSQVYDGACPNAGILKAHQWAESGKADGARIRSLETSYRVKLPGGAVVVPSPGMPWVNAPEAYGLAGYTGVTVGGASASVAGGGTMAARKPLSAAALRSADEDDPKPGAEDGDDEEEDLDGTATVGDDPEEETLTEDDEADDEDDSADGGDDEGEEETETEDDSAGESSGDEDDERAMLAELAREYRPHNIRLSASVRENITALADAVIRLRAEKRELRTLADQGARYQEKLLTEAKRQGVRASGKRFNPEKWEPRLQRALDGGDYEYVEDMIAEWKAQGDERYAGGRRSVDGDETAPDGGTGSLEESRNAQEPTPIRSIDEDDRWYGRS